MVLGVPILKHFRVRTAAIAGIFVIKAVGRIVGGEVFFWNVDLRFGITKVRMS